MSPQQIFTEIGKRYGDNAPAGVNAQVNFALSGENGGSWYVDVQNGTLSVHDGSADSPSATLAMDGDDFVAMSTGQLNPMAAFMGGKIKVDGDLGIVMKLQALFGL